MDTGVGKGVVVLSYWCTKGDFYILCIFIFKVPHGKHALILQLEGKELVNPLEPD